MEIRDLKFSNVKETSILVNGKENNGEVNERE
jgi:hypothetical protein